MKIAMDMDEMESVRARLNEATDRLSSITIPMPSSADLGAAVLGGAAASFEAAIGRQTRALRERLCELGEGVSHTVSDMAVLEDTIVSGLAQYEERLG